MNAREGFFSTISQHGGAIVRNKALAVLAAMSVSAGASASTVSNAIVTGISIDTQSGNVAFITVNVAKSGGNPSCSTSGFSYVLPLTTSLENQFLAVLLAARTSQIPVQGLTGDGLCDVFGNTETLVGVTF